MSEENKNPEVENKAEANETLKTEEPKAEAKQGEAKKETPKIVYGEARKPSAAASKPKKAVDKKAKGAKADSESDSSEDEESTEETDFDPKKGGKGPRGKKSKTRRSRGEKTEQSSEFTEKVVQVRRVTKVVKGGKKLSFRAVVIIGNEKGKVGVGVGKASEVVNAIKKAVSDARKNLVDVRMVGSTVSHNINGKAGGSKVLLKPAAEGTGLIAGGSARTVLELSGIGDILSKSQGSKSPLNVARATIRALQKTKTFKDTAEKRGLSVKQMIFG